MPRNAEWEEKFVRAYVVKSKRERYLSHLKSSKHRPKILNRLNHALDYDSRLATNLAKSHRTDQSLIDLLTVRGVSGNCFLMADDQKLDGAELSLEEGVSELTICYDGAVLICPPKPIALYKPEDIGFLILLS